MIRDWSRLDGNALSLQILWNGNFSFHERVVQALEDDNITNSQQISNQQINLHRKLSEQYIARYESNRVSAAYSALDFSLTVVISHEIVATRGGDGDGDGLLCGICHEMIYIRKRAKQLPCSHLCHVNFHARYADIDFSKHSTRNSLLCNRFSSFH